MRAWLIAAGAMLALGACSKGAGVPAPAPANTAAAGAPANTTAAAPAASSFQIGVSLTPAAAGEIAGAGQDVIISADFYGMANAQGKSRADEMGQIALAPRRG
jgi:hypothetical protein